MFRVGKDKRANTITPIGSIIDGIARQFKLEKQFTVAALQIAWKDIAGELASASTPEKIDNNILYVSASHPAIANEIIMLKSALISRCKEIFGHTITDVRTIKAKG